MEDLTGTYTYNGYDSKSDNGEVFKYTAFRTNLKTKDRTTFKRQARFVDHTIFRACLDRWNSEGRKYANEFRWSYEPAKL